MYKVPLLSNRSIDNFEGHYVTLWDVGGLVAAVLVSLFSVSVLDAQTSESGSIRGTVIDSRDDRPLVGHPLRLAIHKTDAVDVEEQTTTDANGAYRFEDLPLDSDVYYTVSTTYEEVDYTEKDLVLSTWTPEITIDFEIGAFTEDRSRIRVKTHSFLIWPPPSDHVADGAVTVLEAVSIENRGSLPFRTVHGTQKVGMHLALPKGIEDFDSYATEGIEFDVSSNQVILKTPLPPGESQLNYTYIHHIRREYLDLSRRLNFDTGEFIFNIPEGINFVPRGKFFGVPVHQQIHNSIYHRYQSNPAISFAVGGTADLALVNTGIVRDRSLNLGQLILIAVAASLAGGFFAAALFKLRATRDAPGANIGDTSTPPDAGWLRKLSADDREHVRIARLEFITHLDDKHERQEISERVYKRLRGEQTERLTTLLEHQQERGNDA